MGTYVVGDIHGCFDEWMQLKDRIESLDKDAKFILVGDIVDRGPKPLYLVEWAMKNITDYGKYQMVLGNHELEKIEWIQTYFRNKEYAKIENQELNIKMMNPDNYDFKDFCVDSDITDQQLIKILNFFEKLAIYKDIKVDTGKRKQHYIIVHGGIVYGSVNKDETISKSFIAGKSGGSSRAVYHGDCLRKNNISQIVWERNYWGNAELKHTIVVHGHTPTVMRECTQRGAVAGKVWYNTNDINVDCGLAYKDYYKDANLVALRLEDLQEFYLYEPNAEETYFSTRNDKDHENMIKDIKNGVRHISKKDETDVWSSEELKNLFEDFKTRHEKQ